MAKQFGFSQATSRVISVGGEVQGAGEDLVAIHLCLVNFVYAQLKIEAFSPGGKKVFFECQVST